MSFADPLWLLALLLLLPLVLLAQRLARRRARAYAVRFPAAATLRRAAAEGRPPRWRRQLPIAALLAALVLVVLAISAPRATTRVPIRAASLMLVLDHSGSMAATDVRPTRLAAAIRAANTFIDQLPATARIGVVAFSTSPDTVQQPVTRHAAARAVIDNQQANGGTDTGPALQLALELLHGSRRHHAPAAIVLLSDGAANIGVSPVTVAAQARSERIPIYTVALGTDRGVLNQGIFGPPVPVPPDPQLMRQIARTSGGHAYDAQSADNLSSIYRTLGRRLSTVAHRRDISIYFLIAAGALLLAAALGSVRTTARLP